MIKPPATIEEYLAHLVDVVEGPEYTNDPNDSGGATKYGITQHTLSDWRGHLVTPEEVANLSRDEALEIYRHLYVVKPGFDKVAVVAQSVALEVIDTGVNMGQSASTKFLQRCLNVLAHPVGVDGVCGPATVAALQRYVTRRGAKGVAVLVVALNCLQGDKYISLAESDPEKQTFVFGWLTQRVWQNVEDWA